MKKRILAIILSLLMILCMVSGCGGSKDSDKTTTETTSAEKKDKKDKNKDKAKDEDEDEDEETAVVDAVDTAYTFDSDVRYVMIYNPYIYDEEVARDRSSLNTGDLESQIESNLKRADSLGNPNEFGRISVDETLNGAEAPVISLDDEQDRAGFMAPIYSEGDTHEFYYGLDNLRDSMEFTCLYEGEYCYVWSDGSIDEDQAENFGDEFDNNIYEQVTEMCGEARFVEEGGKISMLFYDFDSGNENLIGFFHNLDLYSSLELSEDLIDEYHLNVDHAIINLNSYAFSYFYEYDEYIDLAYSTIAHEFQHLIAMSDFFYTRGEGTSFNSWLNEAMSGYVEEQLYPGCKENEGDFSALESSDLIREGQSLYNFTTDADDIGVYGSVYLFAVYLAENYGEDIFADIHSYWRDSNSKTLSCAEAIRASVSESDAKSISKKFIYPEDVELPDDDSLWLSKLALDFYMTMFTETQNKKSECSNIDAEYLLYDEIDPADIEGGGRIIVQTSDDSFTIPEEADYGLIYIGFDEDFEFVDEIIYK